MARAGYTPPPFTGAAVSAATFGFSNFSAGDDLGADGAEVVVEGRLTDGAVFVADNVLAKCPSKFEAQATQPASF